MPTRNASATWEGGLKGGKGSFNGESGIGGSYSFGSRFESAPASNPEELLAAAVASCYSMALSGILERKGSVPRKIETKAACTIEKEGDGFKVKSMRLTVAGDVPGVDEAGFREAAEAAKTGCPMSGAIKGNVKIDLDAKLTAGAAPRDKEASREARA